MKANELRIENFVFNDENEICRIVRIETKEYTEWNSGDEFSITVQKLNNNRYYQSILKPIPLTEEWLLRFGFKKNEPEISDGYFNWWNKEKSVSVDVEYVLTDNGIELLYYFVLQDINGSRPYKNIIYVHQLQNLFYCLRGEELKLK